MKGNERSKNFLSDIVKNISLPNEEWEKWSAEFNKILKNAIMFGTDEEKLKYRYVFTYWQIQNRLRNIGIFDIFKKRILIKDAENISREILNEQ